MKNNLFYFVFIGFLAITACGIRKNAEKPSVQNHPSAILVDDFSAYQNSASTTIINASVSGNLLELNISYSGGCEEHTFELYGATIIQKSLPPKRSIFLYHNSNNDSCRELIEKELIFDISNLAYDKGEIELVLANYSTPIAFTLAN